MKKSSWRGRLSPSRMLRRGTINTKTGSPQLREEHKMISMQAEHHTHEHAMEIFPSEFLKRLQAGETVQVPVRFLSPHPVMVELLSPLPASQFESLHVDIGQHGIQVDLVAVLEATDDGQSQLKLIDGRHRWESACQHSFETVPVKLVTISDRQTLEEIVVQHNEVRRRMGTNQRALAAAILKNHYVSHAAARQRAAVRHNDAGKHRPNGAGNEVSASRDLAGFDFGISGKTVDAGDTVRRRQHPELLGTVEDDEITVSQGADLAVLLPDAEQDEQLRQILLGANGLSTKKSVAAFLKEEKRWQNFNAGRTGEFITVDRQFLSSMIVYRARVDQEIARCEKLELWLLEQAETSAGRLLPESRLLPAIKTIKDRLRRVRPFDLCPGCLADQCRGCDVCFQSGWLSEAEYQTWEHSAEPTGDDENARDSTISENRPDESQNGKEVE